MLRVSFVVDANGGFKLLFGCVVCCLLISFGGCDGLASLLLLSFAVGLVVVGVVACLIVLFSSLLCLGGLFVACYG